MHAVFCFQLKLSVKELRDKVTAVNLQGELKESLSFPTDLLDSQMGLMKQKAKPFQTFSPALEEDIQALWDRCLKVESQLQVLKQIFQRQTICSTMQAKCY